jgi:valyl-tRNA synthetase
MTDQTANMLDKTFDPADIEARWYAHWEANGCFRPARPDAAPFTIVNPPPNVTGSLHIGHALDNTLQDIVIRYERLRGKDALWVVGTDHAGIATQMVVERQMEARQDKRTNYTRDSSSTRCGNGRPRAAAPSPASCAALAARWTGAASSSPWTRISPRRW